MIRSFARVRNSIVPTFITLSPSTFFNFFLRGVNVTMDNDNNLCNYLSTSYPAVVDENKTDISLQLNDPRNLEDNKVKDNIDIKECSKTMSIATSADSADDQIIFTRGTDVELRLESQGKKVERLTKAEKKKLKYLRVTEFRKAKRLKKRQKRKENAPSYTEEERIAYRKMKKLEQEESDTRLANAQVNGLKVCIDLSFTHSHPAEINSLYNQLSICYGILKKAQMPVHLHITSLQSESSELYQGLRHHVGFHRWKYVERMNEGPWESSDIIQKENIIYLTRIIKN